mmetsp:Transcript_89039/g.195066  ORF Transcript_89039/g.195066 Transcript_89039/m.195066 type:complete len:439 (-) Transcript_89039:60-1376(-)
MADPDDTLATPPATPLFSRQSSNRRHSAISECSDDTTASGLGYANWDMNATNCAECQTRLMMGRRHHCRFCGRSVCGNCSKTNIVIDTGRPSQRCCARCATNVVVAPGVVERLHKLSSRLREQIGSQEAPQAPEGLSDGTWQCEAAATAVGEALTLAAQRTAEEVVARQAAEKDLLAATEMLWTVSERLQALCGTLTEGSTEDTPSAPSRSCSTDWKGAVGHCGKVLAEAERTLVPRSTWAWTARTPPRSPAANMDRRRSTVSERSLRVRPLMSRTSSEISNTQWEENTKDCGVCGAALGKRRLNPRHHCRLCGKCVCGACSKSWVPILGESKAVERACAPCAELARVAPSAVQRLQKLGDRLERLGRSSSSSRPSSRLPGDPGMLTGGCDERRSEVEDEEGYKQAKTFDEVITNCEVALLNLEEPSGRSRAPTSPES